MNNLQTHVNGEPTYLHLTGCELLNDIITLMDLRKNTENCSNNWKPSFEHNFSTIASLTVRSHIFAMERAMSIKQEYFNLFKTYYYSKNIKKSIYEKGEFVMFSQIRPVTYNCKDANHG